jgi:C-terminal duplication domain of Friend of PRMT1
MVRSSSTGRKPRHAVGKKEGDPAGAGGRKGGSKKGSKTPPAKKANTTKARTPASAGGKGKSSPKPQGNGGRRGASREAKKPATAEELDAGMDEYWLKSSNKEIAGKKLDDDMDAYWEKKGEKKVESAVEENPVEEGKSAEVEEETA